MRMTSRTLLLLACTSFGSASCSDDGQVNQPVSDGGLDSTTVDVSSESSTSTSPASSGGPSSNTSSETSVTSAETAVTEVSSSEPDASFSSSDTTLSTEPSTNGESSDAGLDASSTSVDSTEIATPDAGDASVDPEEVEFLTPRGRCELPDRVGRFTFEAQSDFGVVQGSVSNGVIPATVPDVAAEDGDCRLNKRRTLTCLPACVAGETCGENGDCIPFPEPISVGDVTVVGLTKPTTMVAQAPSFLYFAPGANNPPFTPMSEITMSTSGGVVAPFHLFGVGFEPLTESPTWILEEGEDFPISWSATDASAGTTVLVEVTVDQHGASPLSLSCEFPDTGSAVVPASMINQLLQAGISGFPNGRITRRTVDHVDTTLGCIELAVGSPRTASIGVAGHTPCDGPGDCPQGQHCNTAIEQCEDN